MLTLILIVNVHVMKGTWGYSVVCVSDGWIQSVIQIGWQMDNRSILLAKRLTRRQLRLLVSRLRRQLHGRALFALLG